MLCLCLLIKITSVFGGDDRPEQLFVEPAIGKSAPAPPLGGKRNRAVAINENIFSQRPLVLLSSVIRLNLFPGDDYLAVIQKIDQPGPGRILCSGYVKDRLDSQFILAAENGVLAGTVYVPDRGLFRIRYAGNHLHHISEVDPNDVPACGTVRTEVPTLLSGPQKLDGRVAPRPAKSTSETDLKSASRRPPALASNNATSEPENQVTVVDVMVVYTPQSREGAGGLEGINTLIDLAVAEANTAYGRSKIDIQLRLVYKGEIAYTESDALSTDLVRLANPDDGFMDDVHSLRNVYKADLVCLFAETHVNPAGIAYLMSSPSRSFAPQAFSVVQRESATGFYTFAHELGHNMGCMHDRENATGDSVFSYAYGYRFSTNAFTYRTVMAYAPGLPIPNFSNPEVTHQGIPTGIAEGFPNSANNAKVINETAPIVSTFRGPLATTFPPTVSLTNPAPGTRFVSPPSITLSAIAADTDGNIDQVKFYQGSTLIGTVANAPYSFIWSNIPPATYILTAVAIDNLGASTTSNPIGITVDLPRPLNDNFINRISLFGNFTNFIASNVDATKEAREPSHAGNNGGKSVWWTWTAPATGPVSLSPIGSTFRTLLAVYTGSSLSNLTAVVANNSSGAVGFTAVADTHYQIAVDGFGGSSGRIILTLTSPSINNQFANRIVLKGISTTVAGANFVDDKEPLEPNHAGNTGGKSVWWTWTAPGSGSATFSTAGSSFDTLLAVYTGSSLSSLTEVASNDNELSLKTSQVTFNTLANTTYQIAVDGFNREAGTYRLNLLWTPPPPVRLAILKLSPDNKIQLRLSGTAGLEFVIQGSTDLINWVDLFKSSSTNRSPDFLDTQAANFNQRFYRAWLSPP